MQMIKWVMETMEGNVREARKYALKAYDLRDQHKPAADWCREMAATHLAYNANGSALAKRLIDDCRAADNSERTAGMIDVWLERHADIIRDGAEVKAMIDSYR